MIQKSPRRPKRGRLGYYVSSAWTLIGRLRPSARAIWLLAGVTTRPSLVGLRGLPLRFLVRSRLDVWMLKEICLDGDYERAGVPIEDGWMVVDIGAGIGEFALLAAAGRPATIVHAFEPSPAAFALLVDNVMLNGTSNVRCHPTAVSSRSGAVRFDISAPATALHHVVDDGQPARRGETAAKALTLGEALDTCGVRRCDFLKVDCEGAEHDIVLTATRETLARISRICLEYHDRGGRNHGEIAERLMGEGFHVRVTPNPAYDDIGFLYASRFD